MHIESGSLHHVLACLPTNLEKHRYRIIASLDSLTRAQHTFFYCGPDEHQDPLQLIELPHLEIFFELYRTAVFKRDIYVSGKMSNLLFKLSQECHRLSATTCSLLFDNKSLVIMLKTGLQCSTYSECFSFIETSLAHHSRVTERQRQFEYICSAGENFILTDKTFLAFSTLFHPSSTLADTNLCSIQCSLLC
jgi:hypothetical protein